jgi:hypothetical protein
VSRFFSNNFRVIKGEPMWLLDCNNGKVTNRKTREDFLFMKPNAWDQSLEKSFGQKIENNIKPLIDSLLYAPYSIVTKNMNVESLDKKYNKLFSYVMQTTMLQLSNRNRNKNENHLQINDENMVEKFFEAEISTPYDYSFLIRFNHQMFENAPLVLIDNVMSIHVAPPNAGADLEYSCCFFMAISPYDLIFFGSPVQLDFFITSKQNPHIINIYRILLEDKKCLVASQDENYLKYLSTEYNHYQFNTTNGITPKSQRFFI